MPTRTRHQAENHRDRRKLNKAASFKGDKKFIPSWMQSQMAIAAQNSMAAAVAVLAPLFRRSGRGR